MRHSTLFLSIALVLATASCQPFQTEIDYYRQKASSINENLTSVQESIDTYFSIVERLQQNDFIKDVAPITEDTRTVGYYLLFSNGEHLSLYFGKDGEKGDTGNDGEDGADGYVPVIQLKMDKDGKNYWSVNGIFLVDSYGYKIAADGSNGSSPLLELDGQIWMVSFNGGTTWNPLGSSVLVSATIFSFAEITDNDTLVIYLQDGESISIPVYRKMELSLETASAFEKGACQELQYSITGKEDNGSEGEVSYSITKGWKVIITKLSDVTGYLSITPPDQAGATADLIMFYSANGQTLSVYQSLSVKE